MKQIKILLLLLFCMALGFSTLWAQDSLNVNIVGRIDFWDDPQNAVTYGDYLLAATPDGLWILDAVAGQAIPIFREGLGFFQREKTRWTDGRTLTIPNFPCERHNFDHNQCWDAAVRQGFPVWTVRLESDGRLTERLLSESADAARQVVRVADIRDSSKVGGCGCTFNPVSGDGRVGWDKFTFFSDVECNAWMNLDGRDVALLVAGRPSTGVVGEGEECPLRASTYLGGRYSVRLSAVETQRCPPEKRAMPSRFAIRWQRVKRCS